MAGLGDGTYDHPTFYDSKDHVLPQDYQHRSPIAPLPPPSPPSLIQDNPHSSFSKDELHVYYTGYTFTKQPVDHMEQKETWAIVNRELMPASQADLRRQVDKRREKGVTGLDQYNGLNMNGSKRKQVDELIRECFAMEPDHRFEYSIASFRLNARKGLLGLETSTMDVIVKREPRTGIDIQGTFVSGDNLRLPSNGNVDITYTYHYNLTSEANSLSTGPSRSDTRGRLSEDWAPWDVSHQKKKKKKNQTNRTNKSFHVPLIKKSHTIP